ncbi:sensor histidine kinase [Mesobacillus harenae]|uniref:sensor histidine kinase n=1 Tax=Mesobacillus harenae TaxID=2213203 RepID=UPI001580BB66|nr:ATP-binding protein [Mesobacillus harenae]
MVMPVSEISSYIIHTQEEEIKRIALELHEGVGQNLYSLFTGLQFIEGGIENPVMKSALKDMTAVLAKTIQEVRLLSVELHPPALSAFGLFAATKSYIKLYTNTFGIEVELITIGKERLVSEKENIVLFRVFQEALANIAKHADTSCATVTFRWEETFLAIEIADEGVGFDSNEENSRNNLGLAVMKERMHLAGGTFTIQSQREQGTYIKLTLPLR